MNGLTEGMAWLVNSFRPRVITEMPVSLEEIAKEGRSNLYVKERRKVDGNFHPSKLASPCIKADVLERILLKLIREGGGEYNTDTVPSDPTLKAAYDVYGGPTEVLLAIRNEQFDYKSHRSMDAGTAIHEMEQQKYFGHSGKLLGLWACTNCHQKTEALGYRPDKPCTNVVSIRSGEKLADEQDRPCATNGTWRYEEARGVDKEYGVSWRVDLLFEIPEGRIITDIKSMNSERWETLEEPQDKDATQLQIYLWLLKAEHGILRYVNTGDHRKEPKHYYMARDEKVERWVKNYIRTVRELVDSNRWEDIGGICNKPTQVRAKRCPFSFLCFK